MDTIKILVLTQGVADMPGLMAGTEMTKQLASSIGLKLSFDFVETTKHYTGVTFSNETVGNGACIKPEEIGPEILAAQIKNGKKYNIGCVVFDWTKVVPQPTNPVQNGVMFENATIIQIPVQWYSDLAAGKTYSEVFAQFLLHEISHAMYFFANALRAAGQLDMTHFQYSYKDPATPDVQWNQQQPSQYYLHLLLNLKQYWYLAQQGNVAVPPPVPPAPVQRTLKYAMSGLDVQKLQLDLKKLGHFVYPMTTTYFGDVTLGAVKAFQGANGLKVDGIVGPATFAKIKEILEKNFPTHAVIQKTTPNFYPGRAGMKPEAIVIHVMDGTLIGTDAWFAKENSKVSSHYGVGKTGEIHQYVKETDSAWHAGVVSQPKWNLLRQNAAGVNVNPNYYTIGIEHEGDADDKWTEATLNSSARLVKEISTRHAFPIDRDHVIGHYQISMKKPNCPAINKAIIQEIIDRARML